jgi:hypothetical protein
MVEYCIEDCLACVGSCERAAEACLRGMPLTEMVVYRQMLLECADLANRTARFLARQEDDVIDVLQLSVDFCTAWARECSGVKMEAFQECAAACRRCAESCRSVLWAGSIPL